MHMHLSFRQREEAEFSVRPGMPQLSKHKAHVSTVSSIITGTRVTCHTGRLPHALGIGRQKPLTCMEDTMCSYPKALGKTILFRR